MPWWWPYPLILLIVLVIFFYPRYKRYQCRYSWTNPNDGDIYATIFRRPPRPNQVFYAVGSYWSITQIWADSKWIVVSEFDPGENGE